MHLAGSREQALRGGRGGRSSQKLPGHLGEVRERSSIVVPPNKDVLILYSGRLPGNLGEAQLAVNLLVIQAASRSAPALLLAA